MSVSQAEKTQRVRNALAIFVRAPKRGEVKTRLSHSIGDQAALSVYVAMLRDVFAYAQSAALQANDVEIVVFHTPDGAFSGDADSLGQLWRGARRGQCDGDLGARLSHCFKDLRDKGARNIVVIGSDAPDLPTRFLVEAFRVLETRDFVFGGSDDGGFYLMGASCEVARDVFNEVRWSSENTLRDVLQNLREKNVALLSTWRDVDTIDDLRSLQQRLQTGKGVAPHTQRVLDKLLRNHQEPRCKYCGS